MTTYERIGDTFENLFDFYDRALTRRWNNDFSSWLETEEADNFFGETIQIIFKRHLQSNMNEQHGKELWFAGIHLKNAIRTYLDVNQNANLDTVIIFAQRFLLELFEIL
jgi:hypothetical protein